MLNRMIDTPWPDRPAERLLGSPARPYIVYGYTPGQGIHFLVFDPTRRMDLVSLARSGELLDRLSGDETLRNMRMNLITYTKLFPCEGEF